MFESLIFSRRIESVANYQTWIEAAVRELLASYPDSAYAGDPPAALAELLRSEILPAGGRPLEALLPELAAVIRKSIAVSHPNTAAHLHTPVVVPALAAEIVISALNQSMDSFDQAPAATLIEELVCHWLCELACLPPTAAATFTAGGTQSNYMGLLLARDYFLERRWNWSARQKGLPPDANRLRILCSEQSHFSVEKAAMQLGLGLQSVVKIACDDRFRLDPAELVRTLDLLCAQGLEPIAVVATAGTTDFGSFDPLGAIAEIAVDRGLWLHVDAAYGGALLLSTRSRGLLAGLERADSVTIDFHKAYFQPISCGAFLLADRARFDSIRLHADYLNGSERESAGVPDLVTRSVLTTRRFEALKLWISLQALGRDTFGAMIDRLGEIASFAARRLAASGEFELLHEPEFGCVVFRFGPGLATDDRDRVNAAIPALLFDRGAAVIGHTVVRGRPCLKLTFSNPAASDAEVDRLIESIASCGREWVGVAENVISAASRTTSS